MPDTYISLPNGSYVHVPADASPAQLDALKAKLRTTMPQGAQSKITGIGPDTRGSIRRIVDWAKSAPVYGGTLDSKGESPLGYAEKAGTVASIAAGAPELEAPSKLLWLAQQALIRGGGAVAGAEVGGRSASGIGLPTWTGSVPGGAAGFFAPELIGRLASRSSLLQRLLRESPTVEQEAEQAVAKRMAKEAAEIRAGIRPPAEDTMAEVIRQEILKPPVKSGIPQDIRLPRAITPTYVREGVPGAAPEAPTPKTIGQIARERVAEATRKAGDKVLQQRADIEMGATKVPVEKPQLPKAPDVSKLSEGPTALQHQVARSNALEDIRNATVNRPGWVAKLPDRAKLLKMAPEAQRAIIQQAIDSDPIAASAVRSGSRIGSAGDLASMPREQIMQHYVEEFRKPANEQDAVWMNSLRKELMRSPANTGVASSSASVRP